MEAGTNAPLLSCSAAARQGNGDALSVADALLSAVDQQSIVSIADIHGKITAVNDLFCRISGYSRSELLGKDHRVINSGRHPSSFWIDMWTRVTRGETWRAEVCNRAKDGSLYWVDTIIAPYKDEDGRIVKYISIRKDITELKRSEEFARGGEMFLRHVIDSLDSHTVVLGGDARIRSCNIAWKQFALANGGARASVLEGADYLGPCDRAAERCPEAGTVAAAIRAALAGDGATTRVEYACHAPGERRWFLCSITGFSSRGERFAVVTHLNVTAMKLAEAKLKATNHELETARVAAEAANRAKSAFLANMSHEIRTPLTAILGFAELLRDEASKGGPPENWGATIDTIRSAGVHLLSVINDILDISKIEAEQMTVERIDTRLIEVLGDVEGVVRQRAAAKGVALTVVFATPVPDRIVSDPTRMRQILLNLAGNAVKFTEHGEVTITACVRDRAKNAVLVIDVEDTGAGMTRTQTDRLFNPFCQADETVTRRHGGTGLGLTISRKLARLMGGEVSLVRTLAGKGSCFRLELPLVPAEGCRDVLSRAGEKRAVLPGAEPSVRLHGRVLLAEDGPENQRLITLHLRKAGAEVDVAEHGGIALEMIDRAAAQGRPYRLLLTDMQMPVMDGYALASKLRSRGSRIAIVALTAHAMAGDRERCLRAGCDDYATKPVNRADLIEACASWIGTEGGKNWNHAEAPIGAESEETLRETV